MPNHDILRIKRADYKEVYDDRKIMYDPSSTVDGFSLC